MRRIAISIIAAAVCLPSAIGQTPRQPQQQVGPEDVVRVTTNLVQTDLVVIDKNDQIIQDLTIGEFELYDNG